MQYDDEEDRQINTEREMIDMQKYKIKRYNEINLLWGGM